MAKLISNMDQLQAAFIVEGKYGEIDVDHPLKISPNKDLIKDILYSLDEIQKHML